MCSKISASVMCANMLHLENDIRLLEKADVEYLHIDIMDNHFVPNITLSPDFVRALRSTTDIPMDIHLMIERPENSIGMFDCRTNDIISIHYESTVHVQRALADVKATGAKASIALNPATPIQCLEYLIDNIDIVLLMTVNPGYAGQSLIPATLDKIRHLREYLNERGAQHIQIEVDGNVSFENAAKMRAKGADIFVAGTSSIFNKEMDIVTAGKKLREYIK